MKTIKFLLLAALMLTYTISTYGQDKSHYMPKFAYSYSDAMDNFIAEMPDDELEEWVELSEYDIFMN